MRSPADPAPPTRRYAAVQVFVVASLLGLIGAGQHNLTMRATDGDTSLGHALGMGMPYWYLWALFVPVVAAALRWFPFRRDRWLGPALVHLLIATGITPLHSWLEMGVQHGLGVQHGSFGILTGMSLSHALWMLPSGLVAYGAILGMLVAVGTSRRVRQEQLATAALGTQLAEARLQALRTQLNPHFLFNAMNSIAMLVRKRQNDAAVTMIAGLSDLLRYFLEERPPQEVRLRDELAFLERYLAVESVRFQDRLQVRIAADAGILDAWVPNLVLQPLVENALKHGIARRVSAGRLAIEAEATATTLTLRVEDDGPGPAARASAADNGAGVGLRNVRARLEQLYGAEQTLDLSPGPSGGARATITLPYRTRPRVAAPVPA
ncbi:MAG: histidine kinase [Gemmatimonadetes bacterium]|nr:MAG: histidine kinase [Gemmatimonadota bacterium]